MSKTQELLSMIENLRQRLEQAQGLASDTGSVAAEVLGPPDSAAAPLRRRARAGTETLRQISAAVGEAARGDGEPLPEHLTSRAVRLLQQTRDVVGRLKKYAAHPLLARDEGHPVYAHYQDTVSLTDVVLRAVQTLPSSPSLQLRLCSGLDVLVELARERTRSLDEILAALNREENQLQRLANLLVRVVEGKVGDWGEFFALGEEVVREAGLGLPLRFGHAPPREGPRWVAGHSLTVAGVAARLARYDPDWGAAPVRPVVAALVHDVGMLTLPADLLEQTGVLDEAQYGLIEKHVRAGAALVSQVSPAETWLVDAARGHHERLDGLGYPAGLQGEQIPPLLRLLAVCDVYAALCADRPHRAAVDTKVALTELWRMAHAGGLDPRYAKALVVEVGPYPVGCCVELADGSLGRVVATSRRPGDAAEPARPVVAALTDPAGAPLPFPKYFDLAVTDAPAVVRGLPADERRRLLGHAYPQWT